MRGRDRREFFNLRAQVSSVFFIRLARVCLCHEADSASSQIESVNMVLSEKSNAKSRVRRDQTLGGLESVSEQFEHRSFTSSVRPNDSDTRV